MEARTGQRDGNGGRGSVWDLTLAVGLQTVRSTSRSAGVPVEASTRFLHRATVFACLSSGRSSIVGRFSPKRRPRGEPANRANRDRRHFAATASPSCPASTRTVTRRSPSSAASIFISRSSVNRPRSALRMREKSAAANRVSSPAFRTDSRGFPEPRRCGPRGWPWPASGPRRDPRGRGTRCRSTSSKSLSVMTTVPFSSAPAGYR